MAGIEGRREKKSDIKGNTTAILQNEAETLSKCARILLVYACTRTSVCADGTSKRAVRQNSHLLLGWQDASLATGQRFFI